MNYPPRLPLAHTPTPLEPLGRLSAHLGGPEIWIKRDDQTGLAGGGNKTRKLEFLMAEARAQEAGAIITLGAAQSNHCRQTAAAAARLGLRCVLVLRGHRPPASTGNILLDELLGAEIVWSGDDDRDTVTRRVLDREAAAGNRPYLIPLGGSNGLGAVGCVAAAEELSRQLAGERPFSHIYFASSSGGTHAGLALGARLFLPQTRVVGITNDAPPDVLAARVARIASQASARLGLSESLTAADIQVNGRYLGAGYGVVGDFEREAIRLAARLEGLLLDPVYTSKAFGAMIAEARRGAHTARDRILFWHTGGQPALFAYADQIQ